MKHSHTLRIFCHAIALLIEAIGTALIFLDTIRMNAQLHAAGFASYGGDAPPRYQHWFYHQATVGFSLLFFGILVAAFVLWLEHLAHSPNPSSSEKGSCRSIVNAIAAIVCCIIAVGGSLYLKTSGTISEVTLVIFVTLSLFAGLVIFFSDKITHLTLGLQKMEVNLRQLKDTETSVKQLGKAILDVVEASSHGIMLESYDSRAYDESVEKLKQLIA